MHVPSNTASSTTYFNCKTLFKVSYKPLIQHLPKGSTVLSLRGDFYKGSCTAWVVRQHWTEGFEPSLPVGQWSVSVHPRHAGAPSPSVVRALWSENVFLMTTQPDIWCYTKMFTISCTPLCISGSEAKTDRIWGWYKAVLTREKQGPSGKLFAQRLLLWVLRYD